MILCATLVGLMWDLDDFGGTWVTLVGLEWDLGLGLLKLKLKVVALHSLVLRCRWKRRLWPKVKGILIPLAIHCIFNEAYAASSLLSFFFYHPRDDGRQLDSSRTHNRLWVLITSAGNVS
jgi:hypothetical protein